MTRLSWENNAPEGMALRRAMYRLLERLEKAGDDDQKIAELSRALAYVCTAKCNISKAEKDKELEERIERLEQRQTVVAQ